MNEVILQNEAGNSPPKGKQKKVSMAKIKKNRLTFYILFMIFPVLHFCCFYVYVNLSNILLAFQTFTETAMGYVSKFAALENFKSAIKMIADGRVDMIWNSFLLYLVKLLILMPLALIFSYYIYKKFAMHNFFKLMLFLPNVVSSIVFALLYSNLCEKILPEILGIANLKTENPLGMVLFYSLWVGFGINVIMYCGAMSGINESVSESAQLDGANVVQEFLYITLPMIFPTITTFLIVGISTLFTDQMYLFVFFERQAPIDIQTVGYFLLIQSRESALVSPRLGIMSYSEISALGLMITSVILPVALILRNVLEKYGPNAD